MVSRNTIKRRYEDKGIGLQKKKYLLKEHPDNIPVMKSIKRSLDSNNIMNPGKVFDLN